MILETRMKSPARNRVWLTGAKTALIQALLLVSTTSAQEFSFRPAERYAAHVPPPEAILGYPIGSQFTPHRMVMQVADAIAGASDRVRWIQYGETYAGRPLVLLIVSSPQNLARLAAIQADTARLADPRLVESDQQRDRLLDRLPTTVWLSFNVHGNESSGTEASMAVLHHLAAAEGEAIEALLEQTVVVIDPCLNPDGRDRYVNWFRSVVGREPNPDPQAQEHREPWPGGRVNHYLFDLNRDWAFLTQQETRHRLLQYRRFLPQVHVDLHEMGHESSYFFFPAAKPINDNYPSSVVRFGELFGKGNAAAFDRFGWAYYTGESFDLFYPGYGDSWPSFNGAIGMTYEQAGHGRAGLVVRRRDGTLLTLRDRVARHFTAALATVDTSLAQRRALLERFEQFHTRAMWEGENGPVKEFILVPDADPRRADELVGLLLRQGIEVHRAEEPFEVDRCHAFMGSALAERRRFPDGVYVISLAQPRKHLAKTLLEPHASVKDDRFYDLSAWSLPLAFGVEAYWSESAGSRVLRPVDTLPEVRGEVSGAEPRAGYLVAWDSLFAPRFLERMHRQGVRVRAAQRRFTHSDREFAPGALFVSTARNSEQVHRQVLTAAQETGVSVMSVDTSLTEEGPDLGSDSLRPLGKVSLALVTGRGTSTGSVGAMRYLFEQVVEMPYTALQLDDLGSVDLSRYNVLVLPSGSGYGRALGESGASRLNGWVERGGTLIAIGSAAFQLAAMKELLKEFKTGPSDDKKEKDEEEEDKPWRTMRELSELRRKQNLPGTMFQVRLDPDHRLSFGAPAQLAVLMSSTRAFQLEGPGTRLGVFEEGSYLSGFASDESIQKLDGQAYLAEVRRGQGRIILFAGDPNFRGLMRGQTGLFLNAVFLFAEPGPPR